MAEPRLIAWTSPTPRGLWHQGIVVFDNGLLIMPQVDVTTMKSVEAALADGHREVIRVLTDHGRFNQPHFLPWEAIEAIGANATVGIIEFQGEDEPITVKIPDRERMQKIAVVLNGLRQKALVARS